MKRFVLFLAVFLIPGLCFADSITLDSNQALSPSTAAQISDWEITKINAKSKTMVIRYRWRDETGKIVYMGQGRTGWQTWRCRDIQQGDNDNCVDVDDPWDCCTGPGTGTCPEDVDTCFSDVFGFTIRSQDVGTGIGLGLRALIWNQMKQDILTGGNDGTFD